MSDTRGQSARELAEVLPTILEAADDLPDDCAPDDVFLTIADAIPASPQFARLIAEARAEGRREARTAAMSLLGLGYSAAAEADFSEHYVGDGDA